MTGCPLPIDWLDLLERRPSDALHAHLDDCASCRAVLDSLNDLTNESPELSAIALLAAKHRSRAAVAAATTGAIEVGQIWWLSPDDIDDRLPVLVLAVVDDEASEPAVDIAPLWTDADNATPTDLRLDEEDSTTGVRWRVVFRRQALVGQPYLETFAGRLTASGVALLSDALAGHIPSDRSGPELESEHDPRLSADTWMDAMLAAASAPAYHDAAATVRTAVPAQSVEVAMAEPGAGRVLLFELKRRRESVAGSQRLAAARPALGKLVIEATLRDETTGVSVDAILRLDYRTDELRLEPVTVRGVDRPVRLVVHALALDAPFGVETPLVSGEPVTLSAGAGISERDIEALEMHLR